MLDINVSDNPYQQSIDKDTSKLSFSEGDTRSSFTTAPGRLINWINSKFSPGSIKGSVFELIGTTMGAGLLLMPYAFDRSGLTFSIIQLSLCAALSSYSATLLAKSAALAGRSDYIELEEICFGKYGPTFVKLVLFVNNWGNCVVYTVLITNFIGTSLGVFFPDHQIADFLTNPNSLFWPPVFTTLIILPLALQRDLSALRFTSLLSFLFVLYLLFVLIYSCFSVDNVSYNFSQTVKFDHSGIGVTFTIAIFSYAYHPNVLYVYDELQRPTYTRIRKVLYRSIFVSCVVFVLIGTFGYITFADHPGALLNTHNILFSFSYEGWPEMAVVALLVIGITIILIMPLSIKPAKEALGELIFYTVRKSESIHEPGLIEDHEAIQKKESLLWRVVIVLAVVYSQMLLGMFIKRMSKVIQILGATTLPLLCFNFPCLFFLRLDNHHKYAPTRLLAHSVNVLTAVIGIYSFIVAVSDL